MQIHRNVDNEWQARVDQLAQALHRSRFNQFLTQVVAKLIRHNLVQEVYHDMYEPCCKDRSTVFVGSGFLFKPLLDHAAASLIKGEGFHLLADLNLFVSHLHHQVMGQQVMMALALTALPALLRLKHGHRGREDWSVTS